MRRRSANIPHNLRAILARAFSLSGLVGGRRRRRSGRRPVRGAEIERRRLARGQTPGAHPASAVARGRRGRGQGPLPAQVARHLDPEGVDVALRDLVGLPVPLADEVAAVQLARRHLAAPRGRVVRVHDDAQVCGRLTVAVKGTVAARHDASVERAVRLVAAELAEGKAPLLELLVREVHGQEISAGSLGGEVPLVVDVILVAAFESKIVEVRGAARLEALAATGVGVVKILVVRISCHFDD